MTNPNSASDIQFLEAMGAPHACVYLPEQTARLAYIYPRQQLSEQQLDSQLGQGQRRSGPFLYFVNCPACRACQPTRVIVDEFQLTTSLKRVKSRGDAAIALSVGTARVDAQRVDLYNLHRLQRKLGDESSLAASEDYREFLIESCCDTREFSYYVNGILVGCTIADIGQDSLSAVYTYFDPSYSRLSIGTYAVLKLLEYAKEHDMKYVYLGLYVASNAHLRYKSRFTVQERLVNGQWVRFAQPSNDWAGAIS
jgi:arginine-tRNA-protein transferase